MFAGDFQRFPIFEFKDVNAVEFEGDEAGFDFRAFGTGLSFEFGFGDGFGAWGFFLNWLSDGLSARGGGDEATVGLGIAHLLLSVAENGASYTARDDIL